MRFGSVCSGIEAASVAFEPLGWKAAWFSEIEKFPCAVLAHHYPDVPNYGDMTQIPKLMSLGLMEAPDILCGGTPCQAFSVAGKRESLNDARGNLSLTFCEIADAIDNKRKSTGLDASVIFWENVPGVLNTSDNAFGCFLGQLAGESEELKPAGKKWSNAGCVFGPQRTVAWRVLDAQYFGVAQRRRRVFVVASARDGFDPAAVLLEFEGMRRDTAPSRETGKEITGTISSRTSGGGGLGTDFECSGGLQPVGWPADIAPTLNASFGSKQGLEDQHIRGGQDCSFQVARCLVTKTRIDAETETLIPTNGGYFSYALAGNTIGRKPENGGNGLGYDQETMYTLTKTDLHGVACAVNIYGGNKRPDRPEGGFYVRMNEPTSKTLDAASGLNPTCSQGGTAVLQSVGHCYNPEQPQVWRVYKTKSVAPTLQSGEGRGNAIMNQMQVRRLTPVECERLQGFPDNYTDIKPNGKPTPDGPRYKALGNSWAVPCVRWIGKRIAEELNANP